MYAAFDAYSIVLKGKLLVESDDGTIEAEAGQAFT